MITATPNNDSNNDPNNAQIAPVIGKLSVVIIEDSASIRQRLIELVEQHANMMVVGIAATEQAAIALCRSTKPGAIILDMQLEVGTGLGLLKTMAYAKSLNKPAIIVLTNFPSKSIEKAALALGADKLLDKSLEFDQLMPLLQAAASAATH